MPQVALAEGQDAAAALTAAQQSTLASVPEQQQPVPLVPVPAAREPPPATATLSEGNLQQHNAASHPPASSCAADNAAGFEFEGNYNFGEAWQTRVQASVAGSGADSTTVVADDRAAASGTETDPAKVARCG
jgi:hypothetical protein